MIILFLILIVILKSIIPPHPRIFSLEGNAFQVIISQLIESSRLDWTGNWP